MGQIQLAANTFNGAFTGGLHRFTGTWQRPGAAARHPVQMELVATVREQAITCPPNLSWNDTFPVLLRRDAFGIAVQQQLDADTARWIREALESSRDQVVGWQDEVKEQGDVSIGPGFVYDGWRDGALRHHGERLLAFAGSVYLFSGGNRGNRLHQGRNFVWREGRAIELKIGDLLVSGAESKLCQSVWRRLQKCPETSVERDECPVRIDRLGDFVVDPAGITFFWCDHPISGWFEVRFTWQELSEILTRPAEL